MSDIKSHILLSSGRLAPYLRALSVEAEKVLEKLQGYFDLPNIDVVIYDNPAGCIPELGIGGYTPGKNTILISLNPNKENLEEVIKNELKRTLAHEISHAYRFSTVGYGRSLLEAAISEGLADHFDLEVNGGEVEPWDKALSESDLSKYTEQVKSYKEDSYDHSEWFFGDGKYPRWTGYSVGFKIVEEYLTQNAGKSASSINSLNARLIAGLA